MRSQKGISSILLLIIVVVAGLWLFNYLRTPVVGPPYMPQEELPNQENIQEPEIPQENKEMAQLIQEKTLEAQSMEKDVNGWRVYEDQNCGVTFHVPPVEEPYYEPYNPETSGTGRFWDVPRGVIDSLVMRVLGADYTQAIAMYASPSEASGQISASVYVNCSKESLGEDIERLVTSKVASYVPEGIMMPSSIGDLVFEDTTMWGIPVKKVTWVETFENPGGEPYTKSAEFYLFNNNGKLVEVGMLVNSQDEMLETTSQEIFSKLEF